MKFNRILAGALSVFCILFTIFVGAEKISAEKEYVKSSDYKGVLTLWHIETFEGGYGSRKQFLLDVASSFEKKNDGVLVMVQSYTTDGALKSLQDGIIPDMVSFGAGTIFSGMKELNCSVSSTGGTVGDKQYAVPWCRGGYVLFTNPKFDNKKNTENSLIVSKALNNLPLINLCLMQKDFDSVTVKSPLEAYIDFVDGKYRNFLGTQRDVVRFSNRGFNVSAYPITEFNDLYQYISLTSADPVKSVYSEKFINFLLSGEIQQKLYKICMFSHFYKNEYDIETLNLMQANGGSYTLSAFSSKELLEDLNNDALKFINGDKTVLSKIKNVLI